VRFENTFRAILKNEQWSQSRAWPSIGAADFLAIILAFLIVIGMFRRPVVGKPQPFRLQHQQRGSSEGHKPKRI
jgi:hypothetical protein